MQSKAYSTLTLQSHINEHAAKQKGKGAVQV